MNVAGETPFELSSDDIEDVYGLSPLQQGMLFHTLRDSGVGMYISQAVNRYDDLDVDALRHAWQCAIDRHTILRTSFHWDDPEHPRQVVHKHVEVPFEVLDWRGLAPAEQATKLRHYQREDMERGFDLTKPALLRITVVQVGRNRWYSINSHHHIILDGWSGGILAAEIGRMYEATRRGRTVSLPEPRPFGDYIRWIEAQDLGRVEQFWRLQLRGIDAATPLPADKGARKQRMRSHVESWSVKFDRTGVNALDALARSCRVTLNTLVLAAWSIVLSRYSGERAVLFGMLVAGRPPSLEGVESIVGMFLNTVPFRISIEEEMPLNEWLREIQRRHIELQDYEHSPLMLVQKWSEIPAGTPLFGSIIARKDITQAGKSGVTSRRAGKGKSEQSTFQQNYPLLLNILASDGVELKITYDVRRFEAPDIARVMEQLRALLESMTLDPAQTVADLQLMSPEERKRVLVDWNNTTVDGGETRCLHQLFEKQVADRAGHTAIRLGDGTSHSYGQINERANRLARYLLENGVGAGTLAAIHGGPSVDSLIALLAVLKAGAAYLPFDSTETTPLLAESLQAAGVTAVLLHSRDRALFLEGEVRLICVDHCTELLANHSSDNTAPATGSDDLACVLLKWHTAESPVAMGLSHRAALARAHAVPVFEGEQETVAVLYPFDSAQFQCELHAAWSRGAGVALFAPSLVDAPPLLAKTVAEAGARRVVGSPSLLRAMLDAGADVAALLPANLQWVCTGEALPADLCQQLEQLLPGATLGNLYSCFEAGHAIWQRVRSGDGWGASPPLGKPLPGVHVYILDAKGEPCPIGVPGELHLAGKGLGAPYALAGFQGAITLSPEDPFCSGCDHPMVATGDLARWSADGHIHYLGRRDQLVSPSGAPLNITSIELALRRQPSVREAAVVVRGDSELVAWVIPNGALDLNELHHAIARELPAKTMPSRYVPAGSLPRTRTGILDRKALAGSHEPGVEVSQVKRSLRPPESELERLIAKVWHDVLKLDDLSTDDNFFELGGHSLSATRVTSRLTKLLQRDVPLRGIFEAPTIRSLAEWIENDDQEEHLPYNIAVAERGTEAPVAFTQQQLWVLGQLFPEIAAYTIPSNMRFQGQLDVPLLKRAILQVIERHEILRTNFVARNGEPVQVVNPTPEAIDLPVFDLSDLPEEERDREAKRLSRQQGRRPWDLAQGPLLRPHVVTLSPTEHIINTAFHHIIADGPSVGIFSREVERHYSALLQGPDTPVRLPALPLQYRDFAIWERESVRGPLFERQLNYWKETLEGSVPLEVPTDYPRPAIHNFRGKKVKFEVPREVLQALKSLARHEHVTLFMCVLAVFQLLLSRYSGQKDVLVGSAMTNRIRTELEPLIGLFVNTIPLRTDLSGDLTFREVLGRVRSTCLGAFANMDLPFEETVRVIQPDRDLSRQGSPLFQYMIINQPPGQRRKESGTGFRPGQSHNDTGFSNFDLLLSTHEILDERIECTLAYDTDLFSQETIDRFIERFLLLFEEVFANPDRKLSTISLLTSAERTLQFEAWNGGTVESETRCAHELIRDLGLTAPEHPALVFGETQLSYAELNRRSNQLAHHLMQQGIGVEDMVGLCLDRSVNMIVGLLGILKAGAAFVPMDPGYPPERLRHIIKDTACAVIVSDESFNSELLDGMQEVTVVDIDAPEVQSAKDEEPAAGVKPHNLAYVIYTSGSTGTPKGVLVEHYSLTNIIRAQRSAFGIDSSSRVLQMLSLSFDAALGEVFRALTAGATLHLAPKDDLLPGPGLVEILKKNRITAVAMSPTALGSMPPAHNDLPDLKTITVGGEACPPAVAARWGQGRDLLNGYGPTETTIGATLAKNWDLTDKPPLGRPLPGVRAYVLDEWMQPAATGIPGELYIGGVGVTRGYLNRPDLTEERYLPDPFAGRPGARMYRTGDLVRWRMDGILDFLGRVDQQVKIRGYRIELGEIESALAEHPGVEQCAVTVHESGGAKRLVAYSVYAAGAEPNVAELRQFLKDRLPEYMVPALFASLPALPMNNSGKVDRKALPEPDLSSMSTKREYVAPASPLELQLAEMWATVLGVPRVGMNDNFFELGGDSISSIRVVARANESGIELNPKDIFLYQTLAELAPSIEERQKDGAVA